MVGRRLERDRDREQHVPGQAHDQCEVPRDLLTQPLAGFRARLDDLALVGDGVVAFLGHGAHAALLA